MRIFDSYIFLGPGGGAPFGPGASLHVAQSSGVPPPHSGKLSPRRFPLGRSGCGLVRLPILLGFKKSVQMEKKSIVESNSTRRPKELLKN
jgi:hypothetical protein